MQAEAKRLKATEKINLKKPAGPSAKPPQGRGKPSFVIPQRKPFKPARGVFRNRAASFAGTRTTQPQPFAGQQRPAARRGFRAPAPRYPGGWRK